MDAASTIFALSSGPGRAGVAVVRVSGSGAAVAVERLAGGLPKPRYAAFRRLMDPAGQIIDEALVLWFPGPRSETGEDMAEFQVHGSRAVVAALFRVLGAMPGFRLAEPGEFARRAFGNGKMDLTAIEGLADLIDAETEAQRRQAVGQAGGALGRIYDGWRVTLIDAMALVEAAIDFSDESDVGDAATRQARTLVDSLVAAMRSHLAGAHRGEIVREGYRVVLAGPPNVGKSSLLNALARRDVAIVSDEPGTTRDVLEVRLDLGGLPVIVSDTAGLRDSAGPVEREGIRRTIERAAGADLVVWVVDALEPEWDPPADLAGNGVSVLRLLNKCDLAEVREDGDRSSVVPVSALTGTGLSDLTELIAARARDAVGEIGMEPLPTNTRHRLLLSDALAHLTRYCDGDQGALELRAEDLRLAAHALGRLTGRIDPEDVLGAVFGRFCIGK